MGVVLQGGNRFGDRAPTISDQANSAMRAAHDDSDSSSAGGGCSGQRVGTHM
ncbi:hypothetical protein AB0I35_32020 [Nocardia sp. NPDC050378]|uniref:hypothetical protein n=1 Tax=Nocardia sp. NPDC050378 TaxID=3155400 RepID=UPI0033DD9239